MYFFAPRRSFPLQLPIAFQNSHIFYIVDLNKIADWFEIFYSFLDVERDV